MPEEQNYAKEAALPELVQCKVTPDRKGLGRLDVMLYLHSSVDTGRINSAGMFRLHLIYQALRAAACSV